MVSWGQNGLRSPALFPLDEPPPPPRYCCFMDKQSFVLSGLVAATGSHYDQLANSGYIFHDILDRELG